MLPLLICAVTSTFADDRHPGPTDNLAKPYLLPVLRHVTLGGESSYDRTGGNDDGFSGKYSYLRKEGDTLVIADLKGPGILQRLSTPTPGDLPLEFTFDGEAEPRLRAPFRDLFLGRIPGMPAPLVGYEAGGFYAYVPMPFAKSLKIAYRGPVMNFYQIGYVTLPEGTSVASWTRDDSPDLSVACDLLLQTGKDIADRMAPPGSRIQRISVKRSLTPGKTVRLFDARRGGRIVGLRISPASAIAGKDRAILLRITFDGASKPAVLCPAGDFFGASWGDPAMRSLVIGTQADTSYCFLPMPYDRSARIELVSERAAGEPIPIEAEIAYADAPRQADEGRFYAVWRRENPTTDGAPFTFVKTEGHGHVVGVALQAQGMEPGATPFFEGDEQAIIDGKLAIHGTGSEDFFNGGWYDVPGRWDRRTSLPLSGCLDYQKHLGRSAGYRFMLPDPWVYRRSIDLNIEHAPEKNNLPTDYVGVTYLYSDRHPNGAGEVPPVHLRAVTDPARVVVAAGWSIPVQAFSFERAALRKSRETIGGRGVHVLSMRAEGGDVFGSHFIEVVCDVPTAGEYRITIEAASGPEVGCVQWYRNEAPVGPKVAMFASDRAIQSYELGASTFEAGPQRVLLKLTPSEDRAKPIGLDLITVILERAGP